MCCVIHVIFFLFCYQSILTSETSEISAVTSQYPYRSGNLNNNLGEIIVPNSNGTYTVTLNIAYQNTLRIQKPAIGISGLDY